MSNGIDLLPLDRKVRIYIVDEDDERHERVLRGRAVNVELDHQVDWGNIQVDDMLYSARIFKEGETYTLSMKLVPSPDGTYFVVENFREEEIDDEDA